MTGTKLRHLLYTPLFDTTRWGRVDYAILALSTLGFVMLGVPSLCSLGLDASFRPSIVGDCWSFVFGTACIAVSLPLSIQCLKRRHYVGVYGLIFSVASAVALLWWDFRYAQDLPYMLVEPFQVWYWRVRGWLPIGR